MPDHDAPPSAAPGAADRLVDDMEAFLRGGPVPDAPDEGPRDRTRSWDYGAPTADPGEWTLGPAARDTVRDREIGPYRVVRWVARGGMGDVFHARHRDLPLEVALKTIRARFAGEAGVRERFKVEAAAAFALDHPNVVKVYSFDEHDGELYIAMEWAPGGDLAGRLAAGPLPPREAAAVVRALAAAMAYAHGRGVLHRDLKPRNVLLTADGTPKVADFGLARLRTGDDESAGLTRTGAVMGTPAYMAPEQADGRAASARTDVYALGAILYEVLTGAAPFSGPSKDAVLKQVRESDPPRPSSVAGPVPADLESVCLRCLSKDAADRYESAAALVADLDRFLAGEPIARSPWRRLRRAARAVRRRWRWAAVAALLAAGAGGAVLLTPRPQTEEERRAAAQKVLDAELDTREPVVLIPALGVPRFGADVLAGGERTRLSTTPDGTFQVSSWDTGVVRLLRDPRRDAYRFRARVRHVASDLGGSVGIFVCARSSPGPTGTDVSWGVFVTINDIFDPGAAVRALAPPGQVANPPPADTPRPSLATVLLAGWGDKIGDVHWRPKFSMAGGAPYLPGGNTAGWRDLELRVTPDAVTAVMGGEVAATVSADTIRQRAATIAADGQRLAPHPYWAASDPSLSPRGGAGLYVHNGAAAFRDVVVEPLPPSP